MLYFLVVNYNSSELIRRLVNSLSVHSSGEYQIIIINNSLGDRKIFQLQSEKVKVIEAQDNLGFGKACNLGLNWIYAQNSQAVVWLINPDAYFDSALVDLDPGRSPTSLAIAFFTQHPEISILGTIVYNCTGEITTAGGTFTPGTAALATLDSLPKLTEDYFHTDWVSGCSLLLNLANFPQCPSFDPRYFLYYEDLDFCLRYGQQGHKIAVTSLLKVFHDTSAISDRNLLTKYQHVTKSYLIHIEKHGSLATFVLINIRMSLNTLRLLIFKPQQGLGKLIGIYSYWQTRLSQ
ncbi:glycosyl transferase [Pleurocapsa sp. CCALA 161]|uniref:glycosyltransferase family 2 protein n=1 Tax=Pleurocapsa sp. CCALA 161 TaxID=2107688 RepID=UPI000D04DF59|nr:glycosyltransferase [Pleurocapsa sp. CCALA 161]PSB11324.1 glycosyl transferase [Pleurocapsa sp. CCALA 161]